jgi:hypothetical protein
MLRVILGVLLAATIAAFQTRVGYRVLDPFSSNGLWTEVAQTPEYNKETAQFPQTTQTHHEEEVEDNEEVSLVERKAQVRASKQPQPREKLAAKKKEEEVRDESEVAEVVHHFMKDSPVPYLPDLTALKQITGAGPEAAPLTLSVPETIHHAQTQEPNEGVRQSPKVKPRSNKRRRRRKSPLTEIAQPNVAPPMPQLPSLAAATDAPLPPEYPRWDSALHPAMTSLLETESIGRRGTLPTSTAEADVRSPLSQRPFGGREPWPSDVSPPFDYFLPPEVLI